MPEAMGRAWRMLACAAIMVAASAAHAATDDRPLVQQPWEAAIEQARSENKLLLVTFLGPDWSVACRRLNERIFSAPAFREWAAQHIVYFPVDARRKPKLNKEETATLQSLVIHFDIKTYPTVLLMDPDGVERLRHGYTDVELDAYLAALNALLP
jgi:thioredoxin-related protein